MRRLFLLFVVLLALAGPADPQTAADPNEGSQLNYGRDDSIFTFSWWGQAGRTYFLQHSEDLLAWEYLTLIESGNGEVLSWGFTSTSDKSFFRLKFSDLPTADPFTADFDGDKVGNYAELLNGTDPLNAADTDGDGLPDDWELFYGLNPQNGSDAGWVSSGGGLTNLQKYQHGLNPHTGDTDGDGLSDADELQRGTDPRKVSTISFMWIEVSPGGGEFDPGQIRLHWTPPADSTVSALRLEWSHDGLSGWQTLAQTAPE